MKAWMLLLSLAPDVRRLVIGIIRDIKANNAEGAARKATEAALRQTERARARQRAKDAGL